jgi:hypothetical protein
MTVSERPARVAESHSIQEPSRIRTRKFLISCSVFGFLAVIASMADCSKGGLLEVG